MKSHNYIVVLLGKSASGKDRLARLLASQCGYKYVVSTTTRPIRSNEANHVDYHFVSNEEFQGLIGNDELVEYRYYDTIEDGKSSRWHYGIEKKEIDLERQSYVCVVDTVGLADLKREYGYKVISIYVDVDKETRRVRAMKRDMNFEEAEFERRSKDDDVKFTDVENMVDMVVVNDEIEKCMDDIVKCINREQEKRTFFTQYASN